MFKKITVLAILAALGFGCWYAFFRVEPVSFTITTSKITRGDIVSTVTATGELNAITVVDVGTQVSGTIQEIYVDFNSIVEAGQLLALIDPSVLSLQLREQEASLAVYQASVQSARASLADAERQLARNKELYGRKLIARSELETSETNVTTRRASVTEAQARVKQGQAALERCKTNLSYTRIVSPVKGVVINRQVDVGQTVAASYQTPTLFKVAQDLTKMQIETLVDEADIGTVAEGQKVTFRVDAFPDEEFDGRVVQVRLAPSNSNNVVTYTVIIHVDNPELKLKPGMTANVSIETNRRENVLRIPVAALRFTPSEELLATISVDRAILMQKRTQSEGLVWAGTEAGLTGPVPVKIGVTDSRWIELVSVEGNKAGKAAGASRSRDNNSGSREGKGPGSSQASQGTRALNNAGPGQRGQVQPENQGSKNQIHLDEGSTLVVNATLGKSSGAPGNARGGRRPF